MADNKFLNYEGLQKYHELITKYVDDADQAIRDLLGVIPEDATETDIVTYLKNYTDSKVEEEVAAQLEEALEDAIGTSASHDVATVDIGSEGEDDDAIPTVGQIKDYVATLKDEDAAERLEKLEGLHAEKTGDGVPAGTMMTVAEEAQAAASAAIAEVVADAPEAFDTLKEIADWIQKDGETGFDAATRITNLESTVGTPAIPAETHEATQEDVDAGKAENIGDIVVDKEAVPGTGLLERIETIEKTLDDSSDLEPITETEITALFTPKTGA